MDEADIYYVDTRNAEPIVVTRTGPQGQQFIGPGAVQGFVGTPVPMGVSSSRYGRPTRVLVPHAVPGNRYAMQQGTYPSPYMVGSGGAFGTGFGAGMGGGLLGNMTPAVLVDVIAQAFAAFMTLPTAPNPTSDPTTDVPNLITYQTALAQYAKRDEQIRTLGNLVTKLLG
jgi:hypothetical protein